VGVLLDGVPITEADGVARLDLVELAGAQQVEVVRGPASALYAGSSGGVVNVRTRTASESPGLALRAQRGGWGFEKFDGSLGVPLAGLRGGAIASGAYTWADGYRRHGDARTLKGGLAVESSPSPRTRLAAEFTGATLDSRLPGGLTQEEFDADPFAASDSAVKYGFGRTDERYRAGLRASQGIFGSGDATAYAYYGGRRFDFPITGQVVNANFHRVQFGARVSSGFADGSPLAVTLGFDHDRFFGDDRRFNNRPPQPDTLLAHARLSVPNTGVYAQAVGRLGASVEATAGVRYDAITYHSEDLLRGTPVQRRSDGQLSPKVTVSWRPGATGLVYAAAARGFEVLAIGDVQAIGGQPFNLDVRPKSLWNYEVGGRTTVERWLLVEGALFHQEIRNEFVPRNAGGQQLFESASRARSTGLEVGGTALVAGWLDVAAAYAYTDYRFVDFTSFVPGPTGQREEQDYGGNRLPGLPAHRASAEARLRPAGGVRATVQVEWQDRVFVENANLVEGTTYVPVRGGAVAVPFRAVPARALLHVNAAWQLGGIGLFASVENVLDARYAGSLLINDAQGRFYEAGAGRWLTLGVSVAAWQGALAAPSRPQR
jgi:iron complex outermembrane receptor protein